MTRELIEDMREVILPFIKEVLLKTNYEGLGKTDAKVFERDFNEILNLAIKALEQEPFINKPCVSSGVCEHDKKVVIDKLYAEIVELQRAMLYASKVEFKDIYKILDKYKAESEADNRDDD